VHRARGVRNWRNKNSAGVQCARSRRRQPRTRRRRRRMWRPIRTLAAGRARLGGGPVSPAYGHESVCAASFAELDAYLIEESCGSLQAVGQRHHALRHVDVGKPSALRSSGCKKTNVPGCLQLRGAARQWLRRRRSVRIVVRFLPCRVQQHLVQQAIATPPAACF